MAVSPEYLAKIRTALRLSTTDADDEIEDIIEECRLDLEQIGVLKSKTNDESDRIILGAVRCFVRWKFSLDNNDAAANRDDYMNLRDELRRRTEYNAK